MKAVRIVAHWTESEADKLVFDVVIDEKGNIQPGLIFGYLLDNDEDDKPLYRPFIGREGELDLGAEVSYEDAEEGDDWIAPIQLPLVGRTIKPGTILTRKDTCKAGPEEYSYVVKSCDPAA